MDDLIERLAATEGCTAGTWAVREHWSDETMREVYPLRDGSPKAGSWAEIAEVQGFGDDEEAEAAANAALISLAPDMKARILSDAATIELLTAALAASQAREAEMREALRPLTRLQPPTVAELKRARAALTQETDHE